MAITAHPDLPARGRIRFLPWSLLLLLTLGLPLAGWLGRASLFPASHAGPAPDAASPGPRSGEDRVVVGFGFVDLEAGIANLTPAATGRVVKLAVEDGVVVRKGQALLELDAAPARARQQEAEAALRAAQAALTRAQRQPALQPSSAAQNVPSRAKRCQHDTPPRCTGSPASCVSSGHRGRMARWPRTR